jgi:hypothetical protein
LRSDSSNISNLPESVYEASLSGCNGLFDAGRLEAENEVRTR